MLSRCEAHTKIIVYSDYKNVLFAPKTTIINSLGISNLVARIIRHILVFEIVYRPWKKNGKADVLSRVETEKTEGKVYDKDSLLRPNQMVGFNEVNEEKPTT